MGVLKIKDFKYPNGPTAKVKSLLNFLDKNPKYAVDFGLCSWSLSGFSYENTGRKSPALDKKLSEMLDGLNNYEAEQFRHFYY